MKKDLRDYYLKNFSPATVFILSQHLNYDLTLTAYLLTFVPDCSMRRSYRQILKQIKNKKYLTIYWKCDPDDLPQFKYRNYLIRRQNKKFIDTWFTLLVRVEESIPVKAVYMSILRVVRNYKHARYMEVHPSHIVIEDHCIPIHMDHAIQMFIP